jgi:hypothetical protein
MMRTLLLTMILSAAMAGAGRADCLMDVGQLREQVETRHHAKPTPQTAAAMAELQKFDRDEVRDEFDCVNTLAHARRALVTAQPQPSSLPRQPLREAKGR